MEEFGRDLITTPDIVTRLADKGYTKKDSAIVLADVLDVIYEGLREGKRVRITGFGEFSVIEAKAKKIMNVNSGTPTILAAH